MNMLNRFCFRISILSLLVFLATSCHKTVVKTKAQLITQSSWKFSKATANGTDVTANVTACLKDNIYLFAVNGTGTINESTNVCSPSTAGTFTWSFQTNETILHLSAALFPGGSNDFTLVTLNETNLIISQVMTISPYPPTTVEVTFIH